MMVDSRERYLNGLEMRGFEERRSSLSFARFVGLLTWVHVGRLSGFFGLGCALYNDGRSLRGLRFQQADMLQPKFAERYHGLVRRFDVIHTANVLHLFDTEAQDVLFHNLVLLARPGAVISGRQVGRKAPWQYLPAMGTKSTVLVTFQHIPKHHDIKMNFSALLSDEFSISCGTVTVDLARRKALLVRWREEGQHTLPPDVKKDLGETLEEAATRGTFEQTGFRVDLLPVEIPTLATLPSGVAELPETVTEPIAMTRSIASNGSLQVVFYSSFVVLMALGYRERPPIDDYYIEEDFDEQYGVGKFLYITKHTPKPPYGSPLHPYPDWVDVKSLEMQMEDVNIFRTSAVFDWKPSNYNSDYESSKPNNFTLEIAELISGDTEDGNLVLRCKVVKESSAWTRLKEAVMGRPATQPEQGEDEQPVELRDTVVAKVFDPLFYPWHYPMGMGPWKETARADMDYCLEAAAYERLKLVNCHGEPWLAPAYYGTYTARIQTANPGLEGKARHVGLILMEHIDGQSIVDDEDVLHPNVFATIRVGSADLKLDEELRLTLLRDLLHGLVVQFKAGLEPCGLRPKHVLISKSPTSDKVRVTLIDYRDSCVDSLRKKPGKHLRYFEKPPHPTLMFGPNKLSRFAGWYPAHWLQERKEMKAWLRGPAFGGLNYTGDYTWKERMEHEAEDPPVMTRPAKTPFWKAMGSTSTISLTHRHAPRGESGSGGSDF
ncbi:hypothetical protein CPLU01_14004 [Colletotrichum plurivorum]|uniref:Uncharacterized protein n=1 Tax=Colletotrichum plurivorum TaxID=2175906 RepID=A0A8H6JN41_9PEZI|nr:hypothetical protein CPLU01_14004 [Colletotrichum plurivorum]